MSVTINGSAGVTTNSGAVYNGISSGTVVPYSSFTATTYNDFLNIPTWVKRITIMLTGIKTSSSGIPIIQLGTSGGIQNTGYLSAASYVKVSSGVTVNGTTGFPTTGANATADLRNGTFVLTLLDAATGTWSCFGVSGTSNDTQTGWCGGSKVLSGTLDRVRFTTTSTDTFTAGSLNILYE